MKKSQISFSKFSWCRLGFVVAGVLLASCAGDYEPDLTNAPSGMMITEDPDGGAYTIEVAAEALPQESWSVALELGDGREMQEGQGVSLDYQMISWSTGEVVETSEVLSGGALETTLEAAAGLPQALVTALVGQQAGVDAVVVLPAGASDLPSYLDGSDAYYVRVVAQ